MLGRTANSLFWMFRYLERSENTARLVDAGVVVTDILSQNRAGGEKKGADGGPDKQTFHHYVPVPTRHLDGSAQTLVRRGGVSP